MQCWCVHPCVMVMRAPADGSVTAANHLAMTAADTAADAALVQQPDTNGQALPTEQTISSSHAGMFWSPEEAWDTWSVNGASLQQPGQPTSYSFQVSSFSNGDSPAKVHISGMLNGYGLDLDYGQEGASKLVQSIEQQMAQQVPSVEDAFNSVLADATEGLLQLDDLANGGLLEWQQKLFGSLGGGWRRRLKHSSSSGSSSGSTTSNSQQIDVLRLLTTAQRKTSNTDA